MREATCYYRWLGAGTALIAIAVVALAGCTQEGSSMDDDGLRVFGERYTAAWNSQQPAKVASFYAEDGSLTINDGEPSVGRAGITETAEGFMTAFPDMAVTMDDVYVDGDRVIYRWTLTGTNTGPGGTGNAVRISGHEEWTLGEDGLIAASRGNYDAAEYERQLQEGVEER